MSPSLAPAALPTATIAVASPWASRSLTLPPLGNLDAYISAVNRMPLLTLEEEQGAARRLRDHNDIDAAGQLVMSHLRLVVSIARQYLGYGLPHADLIQEGNIGLMKAVKRFDPDRGVRLVSFAMHWIKAEIHEYILKNWRLVKVATTKAQRKLFFNLRSRKPDAHTLGPDAVDAIARELNVRPQDVIEMETRMGGGDIALDPAAHTVLIRDRPVELSPREFDLLHAFTLHPGVVLSVDDLLGQVWGAEFIGEPQVVYVHIRWLREKIEDNPNDPKRIITMHSVGYKLAPQED